MGGRFWRGQKPFQTSLKQQTSYGCNSYLHDIVDIFGTVSAQHLLRETFLSRGIHITKISMLHLKQKYTKKILKKSDHWYPWNSSVKVFLMEVFKCSEYLHKCDSYYTFVVTLQSVIGCKVTEVFFCCCFLFDSFSPSLLMNGCLGNIQ